MLFYLIILINIQEIDPLINVTFCKQLRENMFLGANGLQFNI